MPKSTAKQLSSGSRNQRFRLSTAKMGWLMIACPTTGNAVYTGMDVNPATFRRSPVFFDKTDCCFCGATHQLKRLFTSVYFAPSFGQFLGSEPVNVAFHQGYVGPSFRHIKKEVFVLPVFGFSRPFGAFLGVEPVFAGRSHVNPSKFT